MANEAQPRRIEWENGRIVVRDRVAPPDLRFFCAALHQIITDRGFSEVILDYSMCAWIDEATMLPLIPIISDYRRRSVDFKLVIPKDESLKRLFRNANWAYHIQPSDYNPSIYEGGNVPALQFGIDEAEDAGGILNRVMDLILRELDTDRSTLKAVEWSLGEIMDNVSNHAESPVGGFVQATAYRRNNVVEFVVADAGVGIPESMQMNDHERALRSAIDEGTTRDESRNAGNGLYGSYRVSTLSEGRFVINSLRGELYYKRSDGSIESHSRPVPYNGTSVLCGIHVGDPELLHKALRFKGRPHDPPYDYIEREFENREGDLVFDMKERAQRDFGSRQGGKLIRGTIENLLRDHPSVTLDFDGVAVISSSFADEVFGRLFVDMGPRAFMTRIEMRNVDPTVEGLIDRAIVQRTKLGNGTL